MNLAAAIILTTFAALCGVVGIAGTALDIDTTQNIITLVNAVTAGVMASWFWIDWKRGA